MSEQKVLCVKNRYLLRSIRLLWEDEMKTNRYLIHKHLLPPVSGTNRSVMRVRRCCWLYPGFILDDDDDECVHVNTCSWPKELIDVSHLRSNAFQSTDTCSFLLNQYSLRITRCNMREPRYSESLGRGWLFVISGIRFICEGLVIKWNIYCPQNSL